MVAGGSLLRSRRSGGRLPTPAPTLRSEGPGGGLEVGCGVDQRDCLRVTYRMAPVRGESPEQAARRIALEQTVELPDGCYPAEIEERSVGRVDEAKVLADGRWQVTVSYGSGLAPRDVPQLLNLLYGNVSLFAGVEVADASLPEDIREWLQGPRFGRDGVRGLCGVETRPLLCSAAKPVGLSARALADRCEALARGGIDVVKDDHGLTDQETAPFAERVERCQDAVTRANSATGHGTLYFPNVTAPVDQVAERVAVARSAGCRGVLLSPFLMGLDALRWLAESSGMVLLSHPTFAGGLARPGHGISAEFLFGTLLRALGSDGVILINAGGRFPVPEEQALATARRLRDPALALRPALPVLGGGVAVAEIPRWIERFGRDVMFLVGGSLYAQGDLERAAQHLLATVSRAAERRP
jgi:ribulose-bisphosphate carboxylase large chain